VPGIENMTTAAAILVQMLWTSSALDGRYPRKMHCERVGRCQIKFAVKKVIKGRR
jgi:hypothetical protein